MSPTTQTDDGRITTPSGQSLPAELRSLIDKTLAVARNGGKESVPLAVRLTEAPPSTAPLHVDAEGGQHGSRPVNPPRLFSTIEEAVNAFYLLDDRYRETTQARMWFLGLIDSPDDMASAVGVWKDAVQLAWGYAQAGKPVDPFDMLGRMTNVKPGTLGPSRTVTGKTFFQMSPDEAVGWIRDAFQQSMGRDPHDAEIRLFADTLMAGYKSHPEVVTKTVDADGNKTTTTDPGWADPATVRASLQGQVDADPEAAAYKAAGELYPALLEALKAPA